MIDKGKVELDPNSKAIKCPNCDNEEISNAGEYCNICGTFIVNKCTNYDEFNDYNGSCGKLASENSHFCIYCGSPTTFYKNNILEDWEIEKGFKTNAASTSVDSFMNIPEGIDEELPFN